MSAFRSAGYPFSVDISLQLTLSRRDIMIIADVSYVFSAQGHRGQGDALAEPKLKS